MIALSLFLFGLLQSCKIVGLSMSATIDNKTSIDVSEIDVASWLSYYTWTLENKGYSDAQKVLPDSSAIEPLVWQYIHCKTNVPLNFAAYYSMLPIGKFCKNCNDLLKQYNTPFSSNGDCCILYLPITGISYEQAIEFCKWRTLVQGEGKKVYRLPSPDEWRNYALKGISANGFSDTLINNKCPRFNYNYKCDSIKHKFKLGLTFSSMKDNIGAYDVFGNVSEMTSDKGIAKGGNFNLYANQCHPDSIQLYVKPEKWLGFRCIADKK
jgi:formylglycine-generating enzyme required for sulfatase activity